MVPRIFLALSLCLFFAANSYAACDHIADIVDFSVVLSEEKINPGIVLTEGNAFTRIEGKPASFRTAAYSFDLVDITKRKDKPGQPTRHLDISPDNCHLGRFCVTCNEIDDLKIGDMEIRKNSQYEYFYILRERSGKVIAVRERAFTDEDAEAAEIPLNEGLSIKGEIAGQEFVMTVKYKDNSPGASEKALKKVSHEEVLKLAVMQKQVPYFSEPRAVRNMKFHDVPDAAPYEPLIAECRKDFKKRGSVEDVIRGRPTGFSSVDKEQEKELDAELAKPDLNIQFSSVTMSENGKFLWINFQHCFKALCKKEDNYIGYLYSVDEKKFISKEMQSRHSDYF